MVSRKKAAGAAATPQEQHNAAQAVIDSNNSRSGRRAVDKTQLIAVLALLAGCGALLMAAWPLVVNDRNDQTRYEQLNRTLTSLSGRLDTIADEQARLAARLDEQSGLSGALRADIEALGIRAGDSAQALRDELARLSGVLEEITAADTSPMDRPGNSTQAAVPAGKDNSQTPAAPVSSAADTRWLPGWAAGPVDTLSGWFSELVTITPAPSNRVQ